MRIIKSILSVLVSLLLLACISSSERVKYYSLSLKKDAQHLDNINRKSTDKPHVTVGPIRLAKFLRQDKLIMQIGAHEIYTANYHRWAEPLEEAITKLLVQALNKKSNHYQFGKAFEQWNKSAIFNLRLEFEKFHATDSSEIVASGRYWFYEENAMLRIDQAFDISDNLTRDGYAHTVEKLQHVIDQLSDEIIDSLNHRISK